MSRFVSAGTNDEPTERDAAWLAAEKAVEATREKRREQEQRQDTGSSLYETLSRNAIIAAKQAAFEESIRLKNQFRALDEDEVEFLDSILESTRAQEAAVKKETSEQIELFRKQREEAERSLREDADGAPGGDGSGFPADDRAKMWAAAGKKRKKDVKQDGRGIKLRKASTGLSAEAAVTPIEKTAAAPSVQGKPRAGLGGSALSDVQNRPAPAGLIKVTSEVAKAAEHAALPKTVPASASGAGLGLGNYSSEEEEDD